MDSRVSRNRAPSYAVRPSTAAIVILMATLCSIYIVSQFLRNSVGVIAPDIAAEIGLGPEALGILSSIFFLSFAAAQVPLGIAIDRYGPKRCMLASTGLAVAGCLLFSLSDSLFGLIVARALMGLGCSSFFMGPLTIYTRWFSPRKFSTLAGIQLGLGTLGTLFATAPLALSSAAFGWRTSFVFVSLVTAAAGLLVAVVVRDNPPNARPQPANSMTFRESLAGMAEVVRVPGFRQVFVMQLFAYSAFVSVLGLWGGPFLSDVHGFDLATRGNILLVMAVTNVAGYFVWGPADRLFGSSKLPVSIGVLATALLLAVLAIFGDGGIVVVCTIFAALGLAAAFIPVLTGHGRALFPQAIIGRGMTTINLATIGGVFVLQAASGTIIGLFDPVAGDGGGTARPFAAYQAAFGFLALCLVAAWVYYRTAPDPNPAD